MRNRKDFRDSYLASGGQECPCCQADSEFLMPVDEGVQGGVRWAEVHCWGCGLAWKVYTADVPVTDDGEWGTIIVRFELVAAPEEWPGKDVGCVAAEEDDG